MDNNVTPERLINYLPTVSARSRYEFVRRTDSICEKWAGEWYDVGEGYKKEYICINIVFKRRHLDVY